MAGTRNHEAHRREHVLQVDRQAATVQPLPYLGIIVLVALLTLPAPWRGLQPIDVWILLLGYFAYAAQALLSGRAGGKEVNWKRKEKWMAAAGLAALAVGACFVVFSTEKIVSAVGISKIIAGLFITAPVAALPEMFATWYVTRNGQVTSGVTSVIGDHAVTMTLGFIPLTIVGMPIENMQLVSVTLAFVAVVPALYAAFIWWGGQVKSFRRWQVLVLPASTPSPSLSWSSGSSRSVRDLRGVAARRKGRQCGAKDRVHSFASKRRARVAPAGKLAAANRWVFAG